MEINITLNGTTCTSLELPGGKITPEVITFLQEWYDNQEYVIGHTSGSTGTPKEVRLLKKDMLASALLTNDFFNITRNSRLLLCLSPTYIAGKMMIVRAILSGANLIIVPPGSSPLKDMDQKTDFTAMVPMQVETSLSTPETAIKLAGIPQIIIGGAAISFPLEQKLQNIPSNCYSTYGMTETVSHVALRAINGPARSSRYFALGNVRFETDARGCLVIHAPHLQQQTFVTNDIVQLSDSTHFEWLGRHDNVINSGGIKLFPEKIEAQIAPLLTRRFFITSETDQRLGHKAILVIEDSPWSETECQELTIRLKAILSPYEIPKHIYFQEHFTETYSGKIVRKLK